jgi:hypothetical protein
MDMGEDIEALIYEKKQEPERTQELSSNSIVDYISDGEILFGK